MKQYNLDNPIDVREAFTFYGVPLEDVPEDSSAKQLMNIGNRRLNTYPNLVKENLKVFFPNEKKIPEDALDDYEEDPNGIYYITLNDLLEEGSEKDDLSSLKDDYRKMILNDQIKANKAVMPKEEVIKMLDDMSWSVPSNIMDAVNRKY